MFDWLRNCYQKLRVPFAFLPDLDYQMNDPATPQLIRHVQIPPPPNPCPPFAVQGWVGTGGSPGSLEAQAAEVYVTFMWSLTFVNGKLEEPVAVWPGTKMLVAMPRAGKDFNAYYDRSSIRFFFNQNPQTGKMVYTSESPDIVSHELGHGILDMMRPDIWGVQALEIFAFHESFGDMNAILTALSHTEIIEYVLQETAGNLRNSNIVSRLAEEMGAAIFASTGGAGGRQADALRNAINSFVYSPPESLPFNGPDNVVTGEPHSFSRVFTGAFYDALCNLYDSYAAPMGTTAALARARDELAKVLYNACRHAAVSTRFFDSIARAMLQMDSSYGGACQAALRSAFSNRQILRGVAMTKPAELGSYKDAEVRTCSFGSGTAVRIGGTKSIRLSDHLPKNAVSSQSMNPLYNLIVEVPNEHYLEYDVSGRLMAEFTPDHDETVNTTRRCLDFIQQGEHVGWEEHEDKLFKVQGERLMRNRICHH